jgi:primosomal protein N' (replication factor Y)
MPSSRLVDVALSVPAIGTFTYCAPPELPLDVGWRVIVPFRSRRAVGVVVAVDVAGEGSRSYKQVLGVPDQQPVVREPLLATCRWMAEYYVAPLGLVLRAALPRVLVSAARPTPRVRHHRVVALSGRLDSLAARDQLLARAPRQRALYEYLESLSGPAPVAHVVKQLGITPAVVDGLVARGLAAVREEAVARDPFGGREIRAVGEEVRATAAQLAAIERITAVAPGAAAVLHGVTGSGKTLVYVEVIKRALGLLGRPGVRGRDAASAIVLVPEIVLTPQTVDRFRLAFGDHVAVLHSALSDGERYDAWTALERGEKRIVVGARSAIFAPVRKVAVIVVDEEHEASYKQGEAPRYHAREVAIMRARFEGARVILGSATPSMESWQAVRQRRFALVQLPDRVGGGRLPTVVVVDLRRGSREAEGGGVGEREPGGAGAVALAPPPGLEPTAAASPSRHASAPTPTATRPALDQRAGGGMSEAHFRRVFSEPLRAALHDRLDRGEQSILLLNRRGYASFLQCGDCGEVSACLDCSVALTLHRVPPPGRLVCHYCGRLESPPITCGRCGGRTVRQRGLGTQQVERLLVEHFPTARVARMDVDTTAGKWAHVEILDRVAAGQVDILLGTQMIAKGLDFPNVTLVGVVDADVGMNLPDFRAAERTFQLLTQVAGRAGRATKAGQVIIQTRLPGHHAVRCAVDHDVAGFVERELASRRSPAFPPWTRLAHVVLSGPSEAEVADSAQACAQWVRRLLASRGLSDVHLLGPAQAPIERIQQRWRWRFLVRSSSASRLTQVLTFLNARFKVQSRVRLTIDRDPLSLL